MKREAVDVEFSNLIRSAATGNKRSMVRLHQIVESDLPLNKTERKMLYNLAVGRILPKKSKGRPKGAKVKPADRRAAVAEYIERTDTGENSESVVTDIYTRLKVQRSAIFQWVAEIRPIILQLEEMGLDGIEIMKSN